MAGNYWIDWTEPLTPRIYKVDKTASDRPLDTYTFGEAVDRVYERLHHNLMHIHHEMDKVKAMYAKDAEVQTWARAYREQMGQP
ncbi:hypothetical protein ABZY93_22280 [Streptomyces smyrnaeus]|uniref:hypothetical protein n=1 Tax=Streptomyces smyrnaeus TaxID=1387713 RepID=UPI0033A7C079